MKVGDEVVDATGTWTVTQVWDDGDATLMDATGYKADVSAEYLKHFCTQVDGPPCELKIGDYVGTITPVYRGSALEYNEEDYTPLGIVTGFNKTEDGGRDFVHILTPEGVEVHANWHLKRMESEE